MTIDLLVPKEVFTTQVPKFSLQYNSAAVNEVEFILSKFCFLCSTSWAVWFFVFSFEEGRWSAAI